jgi:hypothetical protein
MFFLAKLENPSVLIINLVTILEIITKIIYFGIDTLIVISQDHYFNYYAYYKSNKSQNRNEIGQKKNTRK